MRKHCIASKRTIDAGGSDYQPINSPTGTGITDSNYKTTTTRTSGNLSMGMPSSCLLAGSDPLPRNSLNSR
jgi:hypothetical protein